MKEEGVLFEVEVNGGRRIRDRGGMGSVITAYNTNIENVPVNMYDGRFLKYSLQAI